MYAKKLCAPRPCDNCPFRTDNGFILSNLRVREIATSLLQDQGFQCHKTLEYDDDGKAVSTPKALQCAGAVIMLEHMDRPNQIMRIAERLGFYDRNDMDMESPVFDSSAEMLIAYQKRNRQIGATR